MTEPRKPPVAKLMIFGFIIMGVAAFSGLGALIIRAVQKVISGQGLDTYRTVWLAEFNYVGLLVTIGAVLVILILGGGFKLHEYFQLRALEKKYGIRDDNN